MSTNTFDRPLVIEKEEDIKRFWEVMSYPPNPIHRNYEMEESMRRCEKLLEKIPLRSKN